MQTYSTQIPGFTIRETTATDIPLIYDFISALAEYEKLSHEVSATAADLNRWIFEEKLAECAIGEYDGKPVGFVLFFKNFSTFLGKPGIYLEDLFVDPNYRGKGFGKALLVFLAGLAYDRGYGRFEWSVLDWNEPSIRFYKGIGAKFMEEWRIMRLSGSDLRSLAGR
ncbi:MAG: hypothetical protein RIS47_284 [Bacteroidota bacterium]|jgi:GNAT superfamily N-acetyltransferase